MSLFNKVLASIGIGSAIVDTKIQNDSFVPGSEVSGVVVVKGGNVSQKVDSIYLSLFTTYEEEINDTKVNSKGLISQYKVSDPFEIEANKTKEIPFSFTLPKDTPVTAGYSKIWISTELSISNAVDPTDKDFIEVVPSSIAKAVLDAMGNIGFRLRQAKCQKVPHRFGTRLHFAQEFEFIPVGGAFNKKLDEIEIIFLSQTDSSVEILMQVDRRARGLSSLFAEALDMDESFVRFSVNKDNMNNIKDTLISIINKYS